MPGGAAVEITEADVTRADLTPEALEEDLARILERDNYTDVRVSPHDAAAKKSKTEVKSSEPPSESHAQENAQPATNVTRHPVLKLVEPEKNPSSRNESDSTPGNEEKNSK
jgi:hypothetical protein